MFLFFLPTTFQNPNNTLRRMHGWWSASWTLLSSRAPWMPLPRACTGAGGAEGTGRRGVGPECVRACVRACVRLPCACAGAVKQWGQAGRTSRQGRQEGAGPCLVCALGQQSRGVHRSGGQVGKWPLPSACKSLFGFSILLFPVFIHLNHCICDSRHCCRTSLMVHFSSFFQLLTAIMGAWPQDPAVPGWGAQL